MTFGYRFRQAKITMKALYLIPFLFLLQESCGQAFNYLPNPGFEMYEMCPDSNQVNGYLEGWHATNIFGSEYYYAGRYYNACDPTIFSWPDDETLGNGVIGVGGALLTDKPVWVPGFIYAELQGQLDQDSLYYIEFSSASNSWRFENVDLPDLPRDSWCIPPQLGFKLTTTPPIVDTINALEPFAITERHAYKFERTTVRFGQCYRATGEERYFVFGQFYGPRGPDFCFLDEYSGGQHLQFGQVLDNFRLERLIPELCCDTFVCLQEELDFSNAIGNYVLPAFRDDSFVWSDGVAGKRRTFEQSGHYFIDIELPCGTKRTNSIYVEVDPCINKFAVPNAFSPNDDGINDLFRPFLGEIYGIEEFEFAVFDRWGNQVYHSNALEDQGWDGRHKGQSLSAGVYVWYLSYQTMVGGEMESKVLSGDVLLLR